VLQITLSLGKLAEARKEALAILERTPADREAIVVLARAARSEEHQKTAEDALKKADRSTAAYQLASANLLLRKNDTAGAKNALQRAQILEPKSPKVRSAMAAYHLWLNKPAEAGAEFKAASELAPIRSEEKIRYAEYLMQSGAMAEAKKLLTEMATKVPDYLPAWRGLAYGAMADKSFSEAEGFLGKIFSRDPANYEGQIARAKLYQAKGELKRAIEELEKLGKQYAGVAEDKYLLGVMHLENNDRPSAAAALRRAVLQNPDLDDAVITLGRLALGSGDAQAAVNAMTELLQNRPNFRPAQMLLLDALVALGRVDGAVANIRTQLVASPQQVELHRLLGQILSRQGKIEEARRSFERSLELTPDYLPVVAELIALEVKEKDFAGAVRRVERLKATAPDLAAVHVLEARVRAAEGKWDDVEVALFKAMKLDPSFGGAYELMASSFVARTKTSPIGNRVEEFLAKRPGDWRALMVAGQVYTQFKEFEHARGAYEKCLADKPDSALVLNNLAYLYAEHLGNSERGLELARKARKLDPSSPVVADTLGWILHQQRASSEALELFKECASKMPENAVFHYRLGLVAQSMSQNDLARAAFSRALKLPAEFEGKADASQRLSQLGGLVPDGSDPLARSKELLNQKAKSK
jgi:putative PEP-CTERM system TPR-repeat lipoprotein